MGIAKGNVSRHKGTLLTPRDLGLPQKFASWRDNQEDMICEFLDTKHKYIAQCAPTGSGKSVTAVAAATLSKSPAVILTSTKALQAQYLGDFAEVGMVEIKGKNAYRCLQDPFGRGCDYGDCNFGRVCKLMSHGCEYYDALSKAMHANVVITNYAYWLTMNFYGEGLYPKPRTVGLLVLDEAHHADQHVASLMTVQVRRKESEQMLNMAVPQSLGSVKAWSKQAGDKVDDMYNDLSWQLKMNQVVSMDTLHRLKTLKSRLEIIHAHATDPDWMGEIHDGVKLCPVWPKEYAKKVLFQRVDRVLMTSATVRPKTVEMLGLHPEMGRGDDNLKGEILRALVEGGHSEGNCLFSDYPSIFEADRRLVIHVPTERINKDTTKEGYRRWINRIDQIIAPRLHQKGIIHTVSYDRRDYVMEHSEHAGVMMTHTSGSVIEAVNRFKQAQAPCILVSPSVTTGFDFPYDQCRWQIIGKIPFPDTRDRLTKARLKRDPEYGAYIAMQSLVQASGRGTRAPNDSCVSFLIDDSAFWFMKRYKHFAPRWFMDGYRTSGLIPQVAGADTGVDL